MTEVYKMMSGLEKQRDGVFKQSHSKPEAQQKPVFFFYTAGSGSVKLPVRGFLDAQNLHRLKRKVCKYLKKRLCFRNTMCLCGGCG